MGDTYHYKVAGRLVAPGIVCFNNKYDNKTDRLYGENEGRHGKFSRDPNINAFQVKHMPMPDRYDYFEPLNEDCFCGEYIFRIVPAKERRQRRKNSKFIKNQEFVDGLEKTRVRAEILLNNKDAKDDSLGEYVRQVNNEIDKMTSKG
jgi:hypothetical protein